MLNFPWRQPASEQADDNAERILSALAEALAIREAPDVGPVAPDR